MSEITKFNQPIPEKINFKELAFLVVAALAIDFSSPAYAAKSDRNEAKQNPIQTSEIQDLNRINTNESTEIADCRYGRCRIRQVLNLQNIPSSQRPERLLSRLENNPDLVTSCGPVVFYISSTNEKGAALLIDDKIILIGESKALNYDNQAHFFVRQDLRTRRIYFQQTRFQLDSAVIRVIEDIRGLISNYLP